MTVLSLPVIVSSLKSSFESLSRKFFISFASFFFFWLYSLAKFQPWKNSTTRFLHAHIVATKNYWRKPPNLLIWVFETDNAIFLCSGKIISCLPSLIISNFYTLRFTWILFSFFWPCPAACGILSTES